jgi:hypothetical protein
MFRWRPALRPIRTSINVQQRAYRIGPQRPQYKRFNAASNLFVRWAGRPTFYRDVGLITAGAGGVYVYNLEEVPVSFTSK